MSKSKMIVLSVLAVFAALVIGIIAVASTKPAEFRFERTLSIKAQPGKFLLSLMIIIIGLLGLLGKN